MKISIRKLTSDLDIEKIFPVLTELRTELSFQDYISIYEAAKKANQYQIVGAFEGDLCIGFMGYRVLHDYVHGKHLYIDDLVTIQSYRSKGVGAALLPSWWSEPSTPSATQIQKLQTIIFKVAKPESSSLA